MSLVRWFNATIDPIPTTLTIIVGGVIVWPAFFILAAWLGIWVLMLPALIFPGLR